jgi:hypothetical protein
LVALELLKGLKGIFWQSSSLPMAFLLGKGVEGCHSLGVIPDIGRKEGAHTQELSDYLDGGWQQGLLDGLEVVGSRGDAIRCQSEPEEGEVWASNFALSQIDFNTVVPESLKWEPEML